ncbi:family 1 encapsulin nanocompartment shell protein [Kocuria sp.]|uniref:family 1 encapsulin nanocompartment shell protein n=1 Tax=Kocuria sp. TaxID=1871328 RepID=UPI0026E0A4F7|nr:family 1 encapsulin nanocompartment shell protein [Kocuria sp.]MDO5617522.1 family 1 encapsulin nanocompartment shell protein [Kocuria sp.]
MTANNLHRGLAPISEAAWQEIEEEARRTFKANIAGRRVVDMPEPAGTEFSALTTGHVEGATSGVDGVRAQRRSSLPVIELRTPFTVNRQDVDNVLRGATDSDWQPVKDAAALIAQAEDRAIFHGVDSVGIQGIAPASSNSPIALPESVSDYPAAVAKAVSELRLAGVAGPYSLLLSAELYTAVAETTDHGYPIYDHVERVLKDGHILWAPALEGAVLISERGGDYELHLGQDLSIGYLSHTADTVELYLQESLTFRVNTAEASVVIS